MKRVALFQTTARIEARSSFKEKYQCPEPARFRFETSPSTRTSTNSVSRTPWILSVSSLTVRGFLSRGDRAEATPKSRFFCSMERPHCSGSLFLGKPSIALGRNALLALIALLFAPNALRAEVGVTDQFVIVGLPAVFSGPSAGLGVEVWRGVSAAFSAANEAGGVNGHKVALSLSDDGYDAERALAAVQKLVETDKVFVLFSGVGTPTIARALPYVLEQNHKNGLVYFGNYSGAQLQREPPYDKIVFNIRASYRQETEAIVEALDPEKRKKVGIFVQDDAYGQSGRDGVKRALKKYALDVAADTSYPRGQKLEVSTTPEIDAMKKAGVEVVITVDRKSTRL